MALKQLILHKRINGLKSQLEILRTKDTEFVTRSEAMKTREAELEAAVNEITETSTEEEQGAVDEAVAAFEADQVTLSAEQTENDVTKVKLEEEIQTLQAELDEIDQRAKTLPVVTTQQNEKRGDGKQMKMTRKFGGMNSDEANAFVSREDIKEFLVRVRGLAGEKRAVTGAELTIPEIMLSVLRDNIYRYSKLASHVFLRPLKGKARQTIAGAIPEGVWVEAVDAMGQLAISFTQIEMDGYKVGGYIPIPNSTLEDSDLSLAAEIMDALGQAIGYALDKAIVYGNGTKMPVGYVPRLAQIIQPANWDANGPAWVNLSVTNVITINPALKTPEEFFSELILALAVAAPNYSTGGTFWAMNRTTKMALLAKTVSFNAAGALVAGQFRTMPVEGGAVVELPFIPDGDIVGGFGSLYAVVERAGASIASSSEARFIEDQTVFRGIARYDGKPVFGEGFVAINIANVAPTTSLAFAPLVP